MDIKQLSNQLCYVTLPLWVKRGNNSNSFGTGFVFNHFIEKDRGIPFIVTNFHVIESGNSVITEFIKSENGNPSNKGKIKVEIPLNELDILGSKELDLCVIPIGHILYKLKNENNEVFYIGVDKNIIPDTRSINELTALEEIIFIGYPNAIYDSKTNSPIIRRGITATPLWNDFNGEKSFLIDAGVFPGSSGSPVFIFNQGSYATNNGIHLGSRLLFIGVLTSSNIGTLEENNKYFVGLGNVVKAKVLTEFIEEVSGRLLNKAN